MNNTILRTTHAAAIVLLAFISHAQTVLLFANDFSVPNQPPVANCGPDLDATLLNTLWGGTGTGTGGGGLWDQINTVETILITGPDNTYTDAGGTGGDYCLSMLSTFQDDQAALTLNSQSLPFVNLYMDISAIDLVACGGPFGLAQPSFRITVYDSPGGVFNFIAPGNILDQDTLVGVTPGADPYTFTWASVATGLDVTSSADGWVTVVFDLLTSGYAAFDNIQIDASSSSAGVHANSAANSAMHVWPNPVADKLIITNLKAGTTWSIFDMKGTLISEGSQSLTQGLDVARFSPGLYVLRLSTNGTEQRMRFVKD